ncbi:hypothetical protein K443DRAFT_134221 [Laccaria amethystina LaAM-08-1]|uniref:Unplaced genomic scaffold K443scaffold_197, whole genome shotgun sequence n=1 Tax=Laccaria amethystina LaAM-08-1 TaxID=1095629 RepID=A0A0C9X4A9_9AGAR|nr:hypothetical protein K443DRAFT_134221 [Laccaria amethystina LaAM-08-1]
MTKPIPLLQDPVHDPLRPSARVRPEMRGKNGYRLYPPANMAINYPMGILMLQYDSLLHSASSPCQMVAKDWDRKTESVNLGNVMAPKDIIQLRGWISSEYLTLMLTWHSIITHQEHIKFISVYWLLCTPASLDSCYKAHHVAVPDLWWIIRFYPWSLIIMLPFELAVYLCAVLGPIYPIAWAACLGIFILPGAPLSNFFLSIGVGLVTLVLMFLAWKQWLGYPVRVPLCSIVHIWCNMTPTKNQIT